jgi:competence CoiA-like predicted nuclease
VLVALRKIDRVGVEAPEADRGPEYICPDPRCGHRVRVKKPTLNIVDHFAHDPGAVYQLAEGETPEHRFGKATLLSAFRTRRLRAETELPLEVLDHEEDRRADVIVWKSDSDQRIAFEIQHSRLEVKDIMRRTECCVIGTKRNWGRSRLLPGRRSEASRHNWRGGAFDSRRQPVRTARSRARVVLEADHIVDRYAARTTLGCRPETPP